MLAALNAPEPVLLTVAFDRAQKIGRLRQAVAEIERGHGRSRPSFVPLGVPEAHDRLASLGLACGVLHEVAAAAHADRPAAFEIMFALIASALRVRAGPALLIATQRSLGEFGRPYGHGLRQLGLDTGRLLLIETRSDKDALWALEETLRSQAGPAMVAGAVEGNLDLTMSRRLNLAAAAHGTPLLLLRAAGATGTSAAATRWRIAAAPAARDRFGASAHWRWHATLERCRNGRPGQWLIEWTNDAHRFRLAEGVADCAPAVGAGLRRAG